MNSHRLHGLRLLSVFVVTLGVSQAWGEERFPATTIDDKVQIGYGIVLDDVDGDGAKDILLADKRQFVWYRNPGGAEAATSPWRRHVLVENLTVQDNVCLAARDLDGDGKVEIAVGAAWNPSDTVESGSVHYLVPGVDRTQPWTPVELHREPTVHRMHWLHLGGDHWTLVVAPLHGRGNKDGQGAGVKLLAYHPPGGNKHLADLEAMRGDWRTETLDDTLHMTHNLDVGQWDASTPAEEIAYIGREGALLLVFADGHWSKRPLELVEGGGEIRFADDAHHQRLVATIEPMHGDKLVVYRSTYEGRGAAHRESIASRDVVDDSYNQGHAIAFGDLLGAGQPQLVAGWRNPNRDGLVGVKLYHWSDGQWRSEFIDRGGMATEDLRLADLDGDGRLDVVAAGRATNNLKVYWNRVPR